MLQSIIDAVAPHIIELLVAIVTVVLLPKAYAYLGIKVDDSHREVIETALQNGINYAVGKVLGTNPTLADFTAAKDALIQEATSYALSHVPDALAKIGLGDGEVAQLIEARLPAIIDSIGGALSSTKPN